MRCVKSTDVLICSPDIEFWSSASVRGATPRLIRVNTRYPVIALMQINRRSKVNDERVELLLAIAHKTLGVESFELSGKPRVDYHIVSVEDVGRALEAAYDAGLLVGHRMGRECEQES